MGVLPRSIGSHERFVAAPISTSPKPKNKLKPESNSCRLRRSDHLILSTLKHFQAHFHSKTHTHAISRSSCEQRSSLLSLFIQGWILWLPNLIHLWKSPTSHNSCPWWFLLEATTLGSHLDHRNFQHFEKTFKKYNKETPEWPWNSYDKRPLKILQHKKHLNAPSVLEAASRECSHFPRIIIHEAELSVFWGKFPY